MRKKIISVISAICLLVNACMVSAYAQGMNDQSDQYMKYNLATGDITYYSFDDLPDATEGTSYAVSPGYFPNGIEMIEQNQSRAIIGTDDRARVTNTAIGPYCSTVYLKVTSGNGVTTWVSSGFMLGPSAVVTAAHCVYSTNGLATSVEVIPAKNGATNPFGSTVAAGTNIILSPNYLTIGGTANDWAIIELDSTIGNSTGWLGLRWQDTTYVNTIVYNTGYPSPETCAVQNSDQSYMIMGLGSIREATGNLLKGDWDSSAHNSGGPVFTYYTSTGYTVIGILTAGSMYDASSYPDAWSTATAITQDMYNLFIQYR